MERQTVTYSVHNRLVIAERFGQCPGKLIIYALEISITFETLPNFGIIFLFLIGSKASRF